jgi:hypothetical protein
LVGIAHRTSAGEEKTEDKGEKKEEEHKEEKKPDA